MKEEGAMPRKSIHETFGHEPHGCCFVGTILPKCPRPGQCDRCSCPEHPQTPTKAEAKAAYQRAYDGALCAGWQPEAAAVRAMATVEVLANPGALLDA
jgi:hypothetical protein